MVQHQAVRLFAKPLGIAEKANRYPHSAFRIAVVSLLGGADGKNNWTFKKDDKPSPWQLKLQDIIITKGKIHLTDAIKHADVTTDNPSMQIRFTA